MAAATKHWLQFLEHEDEAQMTGMLFEVVDDGVVVSETFLFSEYESAGKWHSLSDARKLWAKLLRTGQFCYDSKKAV